ncbi:acyloxyacyl hydrolase [Arachidicoccus soli]|uniref:Outer membrane protein beta-barrel domain-containing protein n=1 Tax=Arachidicoccus soli TaxID=2341117 RepID=A0A386HQ84_9BACT|nr:acyloxyacyl hydrolase [Arachidicoccus soli]AYD48108.1 hypothetical protein D6B99_11195 [Arachidicoccus soli]
MKNLTKIGLFLFTILLGVATKSNAQSSTQRSNIILSVGPQSNLPLGTFKDAYDWSIGGSIQGDFAVLKNDLYVVVNAGYDNFFAKKDLTNAKDLGLVPVKAGLKYYFPTTNLYVQGTAGAAFLTNKSDVNADKSTAFLYSPQIGYLLNLGNKNYLDLGVNFQSISKINDNGSAINSLGLRVSYNFGL